jgi:anti-anti-sigma factor
MVQIAEGWELDVERGPDWLFVRPHYVSPQATDTPPLAEQIWSILEQNFTNRLVLELDQLPFLHSYLIGQLVWLHKRIHTQGGIMRISGLSTPNQEVLRICQLDGRFPQYPNREDAVMGYRPTQPR